MIPECKAEQAYVRNQKPVPVILANNITKLLNMRYFLFLFIIAVTSCTTSKQDYNPNVTYIVAQTPIYDLYVSKKDIMDYINREKNRNRFSHANYDCINKINKNVSFRISGKEKAYALELSNIDKYEIADIFEYCAIDLFKYKKVLVYDKYRMKWIDYKIKFVRSVILDEDYSCHMVISKKDKKEIYVIP